MTADLPEGIDIRCCDCLGPQGLPSLADGSVDLTVTSPPYDNLRQYGGYVFNFEGTARELWRVTKPGGVVVWVVGDATVDGSETGTSFEQALHFKRLGFNLHDTMIFRKANPMPLSHNRYEQYFEYMFVLSKDKPKTFNPIKEECGVIRQRNWGSRHGGSSKERAAAGRARDEQTTTNPTRIKENIWSYMIGSHRSSSDKTAFQHPAIFPEALARDHILSWSNPGDLVLDPFLGSGTTAKMAYIHGRRCIGMEVNPAYVDIAKSRLRQQRLVF